jgi:sugar (pentulose or hexulose) kinase
VIGEGAKSPLWRQILADISGVLLVTVRSVEGAAYGATILAVTGAGIFPNVAATCAPAIFDQFVQRALSHRAADYNDTLLIHSALEKGEFLGGSERPYRFSGHETDDTSETIL